MAAFQELTKFLRVNKIDTGHGVNLAFAQTMYPQYGDSCNNGALQAVTYDPAGRQEPTLPSQFNLCRPGMELYDVETMTLRPELNVAGLKAEHEDTLLGESITGFMRQYGLSQALDVRPVPGNFDAFLSSYASADRKPEFLSYTVPPLNRS